VIGICYFFYSALRKPGKGYSLFLLARVNNLAFAGGTGCHHLAGRLLILRQHGQRVALDVLALQFRFDSGLLPSEVETAKLQRGRGR
jgi:hypothetical protein